MGALLLFVGGNQSFAEHALMPYRIRHINGAELDWLSGQVVALGRVRVLYDMKTRKDYGEKLGQQAKQVARDMLMEALNEVAISDDRRVADLPELAPLMQRILDASPAKEVPSELRKELIVSLDARLWGERGLAGLVILADKPAREDIEPATAAHAAAEPPAPGKIGEETTSNEPSAAPVSGLIIDATAIPDASPALLARILDEDGRLIYGPEIAGERFVAERGTISYALLNASGEPMVRGWVREGANPMEVRAVAATGPSKTDLVISVADGERIRAAAGGARFLEECQVIALMAPPVQKTPPSRQRRLPPAREEQLPPPRNPH